MEKNLQLSISLYLNAKRKLPPKSLKLLLVIFLVMLQVATYATPPQSQKVTIKVENATIKTVIQEIERQSKLGFIYDESEVNALSAVNLNVSDMEVYKVLELVLRNSVFTYRIENETIIIAKKNSVPSNQKPKSWTIKGKVVDEKGNPLAGATIVVKGTTSGAITDSQGNYVVVISEKKGTILTCSFLGYKEQEIIINDESVKNIKLIADIAKIDDVVVIGYGTREQKTLVGSVSSVKEKDLKERPSASLEALLQGRMAGVSVTNASGAPGGGGSVVNIRGYNSLMINANSRDGNAKPINDGSPLYVIDGVPVNSFSSPVTGTNTMAEIDPSTIESVEVLKDAASAAIYGSRASNGVILITTKKGQSGKAKFSVNFSQSFSMLPETPYQVGGHMERLYHIANGKRYATSYRNNKGEYVYPTTYFDPEDIYSDGEYDYFWNKGESKKQGLNGTSVDRPLQDSLNPFFNNSTNWYKYVFRVGKISNANVQASGGTDNMRYLVAGGFYDEKGIMQGSDFTRINLISNLNANPAKNLSMDTRIYLAYTDRSRGKANTTGIAPSRFEKFTVDPSAMSTLMPGDGEIEDYAIRMLNETSELLTSVRLRASFALKYQIIPGMNLSTNASIDATEASRNSFEPSYLDVNNGWSISEGYVNRDVMFTNENLFTYQFTIKEKHSFDLLAGIAYTRSSNAFVGGSGKGSPSNFVEYVNPDFPSLAPDAADKITAMQTYRSSATERILLSYLGRFAYNYKKKYIAELSVRRDGSSVFGENVRWATFPSVALGWAFKEESFMKNAWWMSSGKIRGSWGRSGQQFSEPYLAHGTLEIGGSFQGNTGLKPSQILNANLTWEESEQYDLGLDIDLFDYRLKVKSDYYYKYSSSLLYPVPLPGNVYAHEKSWQNAMEISNQGVEIELIADILRNTGVKWRSRFNISRNWNRFEKTIYGIDFDNMIIGKPLFGIMVYKDQGIIQDKSQVPMYYTQEGGVTPLYSTGVGPYRPGMRLVADLDMSGRISPDEDTYFAGSAVPKAYGGWANELTYKNFDLNFLFTFTLGRSLINGYATRSLMFDRSFAPIFANIDPNNFWQKPGDTGKLPALENANYMLQGQFDGNFDTNIEKVSYLRLQQTTIGYNLPVGKLKKIKIEKVRLFVTAENLFMLSNYSGVDPEVVDPSSGIDYGKNYPLARKFTLGLTVNF